MSIVTVAKEFVKKILADSHTHLSRKIETTASLLWRGILKRTHLERRRPRLLVCFSGVDASGKTTHALDLFTRLRKKGFDVRYVWSRGFGLSFEPLLSVVRRLFGLRQESMSRETYANRREFLLRDKGSRKLWSFLVVSDHLLQVAFQVASQLRLCDLVICDRYVHDTLIDVRCELGTRVSNPLMKLLGNLVPKPDIVFFLDASPGEIERRKEGAKDRSTECKILAYHRLAKEAKNVFTINTDAPLAQNRNRVVDFVLKKFYSST